MKIGETNFEFQLNTEEPMDYESTYNAAIQSSAQEMAIALILVFGGIGLLIGLICLWQNRQAKRQMRPLRTPPSERPPNVRRTPRPRDQRY